MQGAQGADRDVDGTQLALPTRRRARVVRLTHHRPDQGPGKVHTTTGRKLDLPNCRRWTPPPKFRRREGGPTRSSGHPELGRSQGRHPVAVRGRDGTAGPGWSRKWLGHSKPVRVTGRGWTLGADRAQPPQRAEVREASERAEVREASELTRGPRSTPAALEGGGPGPAAIPRV